MRDGFSAVRAELADTRRDILEIMEFGFKATRQLIDETRTDMRMLHEVIVSRIATLGKN